MENKKIKAILEKIGLSKLEVEYYLALLKRSPQKASEISKRFSTPKATVLLALNRLADEFGIVKRSRQKNSFLFLVEDVKELLLYLEREELDVTNQKKELTDLIPELRSMQHFELSKPKIYYFEGLKGIQQALEQVLEECDGEYIAYGVVDDAFKFLPNLYPDYYERRVAKKINIKAIMPALPLSIKEAAEDEIKRQRKSHLIPAKWYYPIQINIYRGTIVYFSYEEGFALMIKSKPIADCMHKMFEFAYEYTGIYDREIRDQIQK